MAGLVGVIAQETARFSMFAASMTSLEMPEGMSHDEHVKWWFGHDIAANANALVRDALARDADWLWLLGDDHTFSPGILNRLLAHDKDIVVPLCLMRNAPYRPVTYQSPNQRGKAAEPPLAGSEHRDRIDLDDYPEGGLVRVHSAGSGGMLIRRRVFELMDDPWFEAGLTSNVQLGEDLYFCDKARAIHELEIWCDLDTMLGHCSTTVVWPVREPEGWTYGFSMMGGFQIVMPPGSSWQYADERAGL